MKVLRYMFVSIAMLFSLSTSVYASIPAFGNTSSPDLTLWKFLYLVFVFGLILAITYYVTKVIAKKGTVKSKSKNMSIVETLPISMDKSVLLIKVGKQYVLLGNMPKSLTYLSTFEQDKLGLDENEASNNEYDINFDSYLEDYKQDNNANIDNPINISLKKLKSMVRGTKYNEKE